MPSVTVIVPNYNHSQYLVQRIDSILNQTWQDFELIILDDCSTDDSREVIARYSSHAKVSHVVFNETNSGGPFNQWAKGIALARGEYIWIAESDDWCEPVLLETLVQALQANPACVLAYAQCYTVTGDNDISKLSAHNKLAERVPGAAYIANYLAGSCSIWNVSMALFKRSCYLAVPKAFTGFRLCGDWFFYVELAKQGDVFISGRVLNYFRKHDKDVSGKMYASGDNYIEELLILKKLRDEALISPAAFKAHLLTKYVSYCVYKYKFTEAAKSAIEQAFFGDGERSHKRFLRYAGKFTLVKMKLNRRLGLLLN